MLRKPIWTGVAFRALTAVSGVYCKLYQDHPGAHASVWWDDNKYLRLSGTSMAAGLKNR